MNKMNNPPPLPPRNQNQNQQQQQQQRLPPPPLPPSRARPQAQAPLAQSPQEQRTNIPTVPLSKREPSPSPTPRSQLPAPPMGGVISATTTTNTGTTTTVTTSPSVSSSTQSQSSLSQKTVPNQTQGLITQKASPPNPPSRPGPSNINRPTKNFTSATLRSNVSSKSSTKIDILDDGATAVRVFWKDGTLQKVFRADERCTIKILREQCIERFSLSIQNVFFLSFFNDMILY